jgi:putative oxidoreductase
MRDLGLLALRLALGGLLTGHGAQKLFGAFEGHGIEGTGKHFESLGLQPGEQWATTAGLGEMTGGLLTALGFMHPIGPLTTFGPMIVAWGRAHWGKPIWITSGGGELPATNIAIASALLLTGPGAISIDRLLGIRLPAAIGALFAACVAAGSLLALSQPRPQPQSQQQQQQSEQQPQAQQPQRADPAAAR